MDEKTAGKVLNRSATYQQLVAKFPGKQKIAEKNVRLHVIIKEALELGQGGRKKYLLEEEAANHGDEVPVLGCTFRVLKAIVDEIERSLKEIPLEEAALPPPEPPAGVPKKKRRKGPESEEVAQLRADLEEARRAAGQQELKIVQLNMDLAGAMNGLKDAEEEVKKLLRQDEVRLKEIARLKEVNTKLQEKNRRLESQWEENMEVFERAKHVIAFYEELRYFYDELSKPLEIVAGTTKDATDEQVKVVGEQAKMAEEKLIDVIALMPRKMESSGQDLNPGPGLAKSIEPLINEERREILEAFTVFSKSGGNRASFCTKKFGRSTEHSHPSAKLSLASSGKLGFTWQGGRHGNPTIIYEVIRSD